jgi:pyridoxal phosphate enzyme (YggS family)
MSTETDSNDLRVDVAFNLQEVHDRIQEICKETSRDPDTVRLVAVSKTKPLELLQKAYHDGNQRVFGENYAQELVEKAEKFFDSKHGDIVWHFIGGLQSNKANMLVKGVVPYGTLVVETVGSVKVANKLNNAMEAVINENDSVHQKKLPVFVQVNTSGEEAKSGVKRDEAVELSKYIVDECPSLKLMGLMTIGAIGDISDFETLAECRDTVAQALGVSVDSLELSMGMSGDYEEAIKYGATNVRVGSTIFGARDYSNKK